MTNWKDHGSNGNCFACISFTHLSLSCHAFPDKLVENMWSKPLVFTLNVKQKVYFNKVAINLSCALRRQINRVCDGQPKPGDSHLHQLSHVTTALLEVGKQMDVSNRPTKRWYAWSERMLRKTGDRRTYEDLTSQQLLSLSQAIEQPLNV